MYRFVKQPKKTFKGNLHKAKGDYLNRVYSDQMVLVMALAGGCKALTEAKDAQWEIGKQLPRDRTENRQSGSLTKGQLTFSQDKMKKGDDAAVYGMMMQ
jgi:hypothetical protein